MNQVRSDIESRMFSFLKRPHVLHNILVEFMSKYNISDSSLYYINSDGQHVYSFVLDSQQYMQLKDTIDSDEVFKRHFLSLVFRHKDCVELSFVLVNIVGQQLTLF